MVASDPELALALSYAAPDRRAALAALFALDRRLRRIALAARDPTIGLMRLTWWGEALAALDAKPAPAEPLLRTLAAEVLPAGVSGAALAQLVESWDLLLEGGDDWSAVARERAGLFRLAAALLGASDARVAAVGEAWARVDLARDWPAAGLPQVAALRNEYRQPWPRALRPLGALGLLARFDAAGRVQPGDPRRVGRLLWHRLTGR